MTTLFPSITEFARLEVLDRGVPNKERIAFRAETTVDTGRFALVLAARVPGTALVMTLPDSSLWLGSKTLSENDWVMMYTGAGTAKTLPPAGGYGSVHIGYWGKDTTVLHDPNVVPVIWRLSGILIPEMPVALPQSRQIERK